MNKVLNEIKGISPKSTKVTLLNVDERSSSDSLTLADAFDKIFQLLAINWLPRGSCCSGV